ncbi:hypothetical protein [Actinokineospora sp.]|uniref:hypothetical protein n=1 Tax=Actinokineospora sp. TaxID=1872133 RepID=UPI004037700D
MMIQTQVAMNHGSADEHRADSTAGPHANGHDQTPKGNASRLAPLCGAAEFAELVAGMVADEAPRLFAVVQEYGERADGRIAAWGMAFEDRAEVVDAVGGVRMSLRSAERAAQMHDRRPDITAHVVWVYPNATDPAHEIDTD